MSAHNQNLEDETPMTPSQVNEQLQNQNQVLVNCIEYEHGFKNQLLLYLGQISQSLSQQLFAVNQLHQKYSNSNKNILNLQCQVEKMKKINKEIQQSIKEEMETYIEPMNDAKDKLNAIKNKLQNKKAQNDSLDSQLNQLDRHIQIMSQKQNNLDGQNKNLEKQILKSQQESCKVRQNIQQLYLIKKKLNNQLQQIRGNIRVYCRIRPFLNDEHQEPIHQLANDNTLKLKVPKQNQRSEKHEKDLFYNFQQIFDMEQKQSNIFNQLAQLIQSAVDGKNVCIFAYGQTGSGKTYTMQGRGEEQEDQGIIPRSIDYIFEEIQKANQFQWKHTTSVSIQQVYLQTVKDFLQNRRTSENSTDNRIIVHSAKQINSLLGEVSRNRKVAETSCNQHSSRSHLVFTIHLQAIHIEKKIQRRGSLNLIDLAGSERVSLSKVEGQRMKETQAINKSLTHLGVVIMAMAKKEEYIPFRNSKLTHLLQKYLEGDSKTLMFVNISPKQSDYHQTLCSLRFAEQVKNCKIKK